MSEKYHYGFPPDLVAYRPKLTIRVYWFNCGEDLEVNPFASVSNCR